MSEKQNKKMEKIDALIDAISCACSALDTCLDELSKCIYNLPISNERKRMMEAYWMIIEHLGSAVADAKFSYGSLLPRDDSSKQYTS